MPTLAALGNGGLESHKRAMSQHEEHLEPVPQIIGSLLLLFVLLGAVLVSHRGPPQGGWVLLSLLSWFLLGASLAIGASGTMDLLYRIPVLSSLLNEVFSSQYRLESRSFLIWLRRLFISILLLSIALTLLVVPAVLFGSKRLDAVFMAASFGAVVALLMESARILHHGFREPNRSLAIATVPIMLLILFLAGWFPGSTPSQGSGSVPSSTTGVPPPLTAPLGRGQATPRSATQVAQELAVQVAPVMVGSATDIASEIAKTASGTVLDVKKLAVDTLAAPFLTSLSDEAGKIVVRRLDQATTGQPATAKAAAYNQARLQFAADIHERLVEELRQQLASATNFRLRKKADALAEELATAITERLLVQVNVQSAATPGSQPPGEPTPIARYTVRPGDSLWGISLGFS
jgi:hypothetical protein